ncbi:hypothetical protein [Niastella populi]|uniref:Suppressor of fused-like domain-containing protein n=1 Tax=Niastella populi TaxID=550983 RepID=A0A1V9FK81_9BACT|nr:hypothetical protein [Niastella populi]OQP58730.1 hypothetical protein A4R26_22435 [Niastella populi]
MNIDLVYYKLYEFLQNNRPNFHHGIFKFISSPSLDSAVDIFQDLYDVNNNSLKSIFEEFSDVTNPVIDYMLFINGEEKYNILEFSFSTPTEYTFKYYWDQAVQDNFDQYLPENLKGKIVAWYMPGSDYRKRIAEKAAANPPKPVAIKRWQPVGQLMEEFEIRYLDPNHHGYPQCAGDRYLQLWKTHWNTYMVCTQGLFEENNATSLGFELYFETEEKPDPIDESWQANIVYELGKLLPKVTDLSQRFETYKYISVQIAMDGAPEDWSLNEHDNIGLLLGIEHEEFQNRNLQFGFRPVNVKLLRPAEVRVIKLMNAHGRQRLVDFFRQRGKATLSSLNRPSAVKEE